MALKPFRKYTCGDDEGGGVFYDPNPANCDYLVAEKGSLVVYLPTFTGTGKPGQAGNAVGTPTAVTDKAYGLLLMDVHRVDQTKFPFVQDMYSLATTVCKPVKTIREGDFCTNWLDPALDQTTIVPGQNVWFNTAGFTNVDTGSEVVGTFGGYPDSDGFVLIKFDIS